MAAEVDQILQAAQDALDRQDDELRSLREEQVRAVVFNRATGTADIDHLFFLDQPFRLVFIRCHITGTSGMNPLHISVDAAAGSAHDTRLFTVSQVGVDKDTNLRVNADELAQPSAWTLQAGDKLHIEWTNPDSGNITWGLEVGLTLAS